MDTSSQRRRAMWLAALVVGCGAALLLLWSDDLPENLPAPAPQVAEARPPPAAAPASPATAPTVAAARAGLPAGLASAPEAARAPFHSPSDLPPPTAFSTVDENPPIEPERPQTPEWKLEKREQIAESLADRLTRLEREVEDAESRGDRQAAAALRVLLDRSRRRVAELQREIAAMREQIRSGGAAGR